MKKIIFYFVILLLLSFANTTGASANKTSASIPNGNTIFTDQRDIMDQRDNNAPLVYPYYRTGYEPNYLNAEGNVISYSEGNSNWSWLGLLGLFGLSGLTGRNKKRNL